MPQYLHNLHKNVFTAYLTVAGKDFLSQQEIAGVSYFILTVSIPYSGPVDYHSALYSPVSLG